MKNKNLKTINDDTIIKSNDVLITNVDPVHYDDKCIISCLDGNLLYHLVTESDVADDVVLAFCDKVKLSSNDFNIHKLNNDDHFIVIDSNIALCVEEEDDYYNNFGVTILHPSLTAVEVKKLFAISDVMKQIYCIVSTDCKKHYIEKYLLKLFFKLVKE